MANGVKKLDPELRWALYQILVACKRLTADKPKGSDG